MADATVQLQADGAGKLVDNTSLTVGGLTVYRQRINFADPNDALGLARVMATVPATGEYGMVVRHAGPLPAGTNGLGSVSLTSMGIDIDNRPDGFLRVQIDPTTILYDGFDALDTTNTWTTSGTVAPTVTAGYLQHNNGTTASATSNIISKMAVAPPSSGWLYYAANVLIEAGALTNSQRAFGLGTYTTPTLAVPVINGAVFELDYLTGNMLASVYSGGVRTQSFPVTRPTDAGWHRYAIYYRVSRVYFEIDGVDVAGFNITTPLTSASVNILSVSVNNSTAPTSAPVLRFSTAAVGDSARLASKIADGVYPWRQVTVKAAATAPTTADLPMVVALSPIGNTAKGTQGATALPTQDLKDSGRTRVAIVFQAVSPATAETLLSITKMINGAVSSTATSIAVTAGKTLRITSISFSIKAGAAAAAFATIMLRSNPSGATVIASLGDIRLDVGTTAAVVGAADKVEAVFPDGLEFSGTQTLGISLTSSATTNINSISLNGFEY